ncbi:MAG: bifunctional glutamate N-acetyltransferase/amino-acid acetyltransferase ArgJ [Nitrospiraceae bacterium]|nr:bifunctional glutamate N-acetyltransferase/amino-acid acetyltransferase ArgJ [Nitrospiraceae bacterium]
MTPAGPSKIEGGLCAPQGFRAAGVAAAIKDGSTKNDCALVVSNATAAAAGTFTTNLFKAPPVQLSEAVCRSGHARAVFVNSGNANACTGERGEADARAMAERVAAGLDVAADEVCVLSTGIIGVPLPMDRIANGVDACLGALSPAGGHDAALAIMTTDTVPKETAVEVALGSGVVRIGAIAKGSGMIAPNMATMISLITTDAALDPNHLSDLLRAAVRVSFNCICIDNDMSTSDAVIGLANGASGVPELAPGSEDAATFGAALTAVCTEMAQALVRDGEGASKFVTIDVAGAADDDDARTIARSVAVSQLCKTAFAGEDPNWGRIACAAGYAGADFDPARLCVWLDGVRVMEDGMPADFEEADAAAVMQQPEFTIRMRVGDGPGICVFWTSDLSHEYVTINADYRT